MSSTTLADDRTSHFIKLDVQSTWNDHQVGGLFTGYYDAATNIHGGAIVFDDLPEVGNSLVAASYGSVASWTSCVFSRAENGSVNLRSLFGDSWGATIDYTAVDREGRVLGQIYQTGEGSLDADQRFIGSVRLKGDFSENIDIVSKINDSPGYAVYMRQEGPGQISGTYSQILHTSDGDIFYELVRRSYNYTSQGTLPFDEVWHFKILSSKFGYRDGKRTFQYRATAFYTPAKSSHGSITSFEKSFEKLSAENNW